MSNNNEDEVTLRDKLAMAALPALIQRFTDRSEHGWINSDSSYTSECNRDIIYIAHLAYKIADAMRKARLQSFT